MMATEPTTCMLLEALHASGLTYQAVAQDLGVSWRTVYRWSINETHPTSPNLINAYLQQLLAQRQRISGNDN